MISTIKNFINSQMRISSDRIGEMVDEMINGNTILINEYRIYDDEDEYIDSLYLYAKIVQDETGKAGVKRWYAFKYKCIGAEFETQTYAFNAFYDEIDS